MSAAADLASFRAMLVEVRRRCARQAMVDADTAQSAINLAAIQAHVEAVDRAIADENELEGRPK
jgi:hypothetical protein